MLLIRSGCAVCGVRCVVGKCERTDACECASACMGARVIGATSTRDSHAAVLVAGSWVDTGVVQLHTCVSCDNRKLILSKDSCSSSFFSWFSFWSSCTKGISVRNVTLHVYRCTSACMQCTCALSYGKLKECMQHPLHPTAHTCAFTYQLIRFLSNKFCKGG